MPEPSKTELAASLLTAAGELLASEKTAQPGLDPDKDKLSDKAAKKPTKEEDENKEKKGGKDNSSEEEEEDNPPKPKKKQVDTKDWTKSDIYDFIKAKSIKLDYNPISDCFTFKQSCSIGGAITLDPQAPPEDLEFTGMKSISSQRKSMEPTDAELEKINQYTGVPHKKEELRVLTIKAANTNSDRSYEKFSRKALEDMAALSINKPIMNDHRIHDVKETFGNIFDAKVVSTKEGPTLFQKAYMLNIPENQHTIKSLAANIGAGASVHFKTPRSEYVCNSCNKPMFTEKGHCGHYPGYTKNEDGTPTTATNNRVTDYLETTRTAAPNAPDAEMKMLDSGESDFTSKSVTTSQEEFKTAAEQFNSLTASIAKAFLGGSEEPTSTLKTVNPGNGAKTMPDDAKPGANGEDISKFVGAVDKLHGSVSGFNAVVESQKSVVEGQNKLITSLVTALEGEKAARAQDTKDMKDKFDVLFAYQMKQAEMLDTVSAKLDMAGSKSIDDLVHKIAAIMPNADSASGQDMGGMSVDEKEKSLRDNQYASILDKWMTKGKS